MVKQYKVDEVSSMVDQLKDKGNIILTNYSGIRVKDLSKLRKTLRSKNAEYRVVKNTLFKRALKEVGIEGLDEYLKGPVAVAFAKDDVGDVAKALKDFAKDVEKFSYSAGYVDKVLYNSDQIKRIADLPSKEVVLAQLLGMINGPARGIAVGMNQIMASLARGIKAVAEAQNKQ
ncbi:MAG TPA: 50S ribosomal protein L10 [Spirochaetota bacterium]|nr:50S ribosomal protein L10 [Spirochaetota bacterium]HPC41009.1 50S ribosomal protein L10 [Spirochaetota bacterium]HPL17585.1 50S ribosomal protein L10 [Spirochaetota bacterium]HQF08878.1 50S ribosomal protein L10 [Spirochaetota bacterium]HQH97497.1 50S ribosomal protein L10 [Spirochaetota bacterium]